MVRKVGKGEKRRCPEQEMFRVVVGWKGGYEEADECLQKQTIEGEKVCSFYMIKSLRGTTRC